MPRLTVCLLILAVGLILPGGVQSQNKARGLGAYAPDQAVVLDGSSRGTDAFLVSFSQKGFRLDLAEADADCPQTGQITPPVRFELISKRDLQACTEPAAQQILPVPLLVPGQLPTSLQDLDDDCDLLVRVDQLNAYLAAVSLRVAGDIAHLEACVEEARRRYCEIVGIIEGAPTLARSARVIISTPPSFLTASSPHPHSIGWTCDRALTPLEDIPVFLDDLSIRIQECEVAVDALNALEPNPYSGPGGTHGIPLDIKEALLGLAGFWLSKAKIILYNGQSDVSVIDALSSRLTLPMLQDACAACDSSDSTEFDGGSSGAIIEKLHRQPLGRFVGAFRSASNASEDPEEADRLWGIAERLIRVPGDRVLHVTFVSTSSVGEEIVAIRSRTKPDDGVSPLVVVLTALPWNAPLPPMTTTDQELLFDAYRSFHSTLAEKGPFPIDR